MRRSLIVSLVVLVLLSSIALLGYANASDSPPAPMDDQAADQFTAMVRDEAEQMDYWLRIATGEDVPCGDPCRRDTSFNRVVSGLAVRCEKIDPAAQLSAPDYDPAQHGRTLGALKDACNVILSAKATLGEPRDIPEWKQKAVEAKLALNKRGG